MFESLKKIMIKIKVKVRIKSTCCSKVNEIDRQSTVSTVSSG